MDIPTQQAPQGAPGGQSVPDSAPDSFDSQADAFQSLWDQGAFNPTDESGKELSAEQRAQLERDAQGGEQTGAEGTPGAEPTEGATKEPTEPEGKDYDSLDAYLTDQKLDRDAFMTLPVTVKVDGAEKAVPLAEVVKGYQIAEAGYQRLNEVAQQRTQFQQETTQVRQALGVRIQQVENLLQDAQQQLLGEYQSITPQMWAQLQAENPGQAALLQQQFQTRQQQITQRLQQVAAAKQQEAEQARQSQLQALPQEREKLLAARPEWRDPGKFEAARGEMIAAGRKLGYTDAELQSITDHRTLLGLDLVAKALQLQASKPAALKRVRATPRMASGGTRQPSNPSADRSRSATQAYARSGGRDDAAGAAMFEEYA